MESVCSCCGETTETVQLHDNKDIHICSRCLDWIVAKRDKQVKAHGGWLVAGFEPIFTVADLPRSTDHYAKMGFEIGYHDETYAFAHRDKDLTIHLTVDEGSGPTTSKLYVHCHDADQVAEEWRKAGLEVTGPRDEDYGKREGSHADPDGNLIRFGSPLRSDSN
jgi:catechol 2,3-dioxygenase-like lactoylglutathione lyase family enzyme